MKNKIQQELKQAMIEKNGPKIWALRSVMTAFVNAEKVDGVEELTDAEYVQILRKAIKQREESSKLYLDNNRQDLYAMEVSEIAVLKQYMPKALEETEVRSLIAKIVKENELTLEKRNMGNIVKLVVAAADGGTDGKTVSTIVGQLMKELEVV